MVCATAAVGCGGRGGTVAPPIEVDYTTFADSLQTGPQTGALSAIIESSGSPIAGATVRIALPGAGEDEGYVTQSAATGRVRIGNVPGGTYELFIRADGYEPAVFEVSVPARTIAADTYELSAAQS